MRLIQATGGLVHLKCTTNKIQKLRMKKKHFNAYFHSLYVHIGHTVFQTTGVLGSVFTKCQVASCNPLRHKFEIQPAQPDPVSSLNNVLNICENPNKNI